MTRASRGSSLPFPRGAQHGHRPPASACAPGRWLVARPTVAWAWTDRSYCARHRPARTNRCTRAAGHNAHPVVVRRARAYLGRQGLASHPRLHPFLGQRGIVEFAVRYGGDLAAQVTSLLRSPFPTGTGHRYRVGPVEALVQCWIIPGPTRMLRNGQKPMASNTAAPKRTHLAAAGECVGERPNEHGQHGLVRPRPGMLLYVLQVGPLVGIRVQHARDQLPAHREAEVSSGRAPVGTSSSSRRWPSFALRQACLPHVVLVEERRVLELALAYLGDHFEVVGPVKGQRSREQHVQYTAQRPDVGLGSEVPLTRRASERA